MGHYDTLFVHNRIFIFINILLMVVDPKKISNTIVVRII